MAWVRFSALHWHRFTPQMKRRFLPGDVKNLPADVAQKAIADGHAVRLKRARRGEQPTEEPDGT